MARKLITVEEIFALKGRGTITLLPDVKLQPGETIKPGSKIMLRKPDGSIQYQKIYGIEQLHMIETGPCKIVIVISNSPKIDLPIGTEVWTVDE